MLSLFRTNQLLFSVLLVLYAFVLRGSVFLADDNWEPGFHGVLSHWVYQWIGAKGVVADSVAIGLLCLHGIILNALNMTHRLADQVSLFPGLFYILFASLIPEFLHLSPLHLANTFYLLALFDVMAVYNRARSAGYIFNAGLWVGIGSLFYFSYVIFLPLAFIALGILRAFDIRERFMVLCGLLTPYLLIGLYSFWYDQWDWFIQRQFVDNAGFFDLNFGTISVYGYLKLGLFAMLLAIALFNHGSYLLKKVIQVQKKINILFWGLLLGGLTLLFQNQPGFDHLLILALPLGLLLSITFIEMSKSWAEFFHFVLVIGALFFQLQPLLIK